MLQSDREWSGAGPRESGCRLAVWLTFLHATSRIRVLLSTYQPVGSFVNRKVRVVARGVGRGCCAYFVSRNFVLIGPPAMHADFCNVRAQVLAFLAYRDGDGRQSDSLKAGCAADGQQKFNQVTGNDCRWDSHIDLQHSGVNQSDEEKVALRHRYSSDGY